MSTSGYIELTTVDDTKILINVDHILAISPDTFDHLGYIRFIDKKHDMYVKERYDEIKNRLMMITSVLNSAIPAQED